MLEIKTKDSEESGAKLLVIGVGGAGNNAVNSMIDQGIKGVDFACVNTDNQVLRHCKAAIIKQMGEKLTRGLGAGGKPEVGEAAALESEEELREIVKDADMVFVTCGMGGGTGTGAAPVVARLAKESNALTVGVVTKPFSYEGVTRRNNALEGIEKLRENVDTLIVIPNEKLRENCDRRTSVQEAFAMVDEVLIQCVRGITDIICGIATVNLDFADIQTAMLGQGAAHVGIGVGEGDEKCADAVRSAVASPMLETSIEGAAHVVINFTGDLGIMEVGDAIEYVAGIAGPNANVMFGLMTDETMVDKVTVTVIATGVHEKGESQGFQSTLFGQSAQRTSLFSGNTQTQQPVQNTQQPFRTQESGGLSFLGNSFQRQPMQSNVTANNPSSAFGEARPGTAQQPAREPQQPQQSSQRIQMVPNAGQQTQQPVSQVRPTVPTHNATSLETDMPVVTPRNTVRPQPTTQNNSSDISEVKIPDFLKNKNN